MSIRLDIQNIAGITDGEAEIAGGVNTVKASNWQGKSSFLKAIQTAFGTDVALMEGATEGRVSLDIDGTAHEVSLGRDGGTVVREGSPVLEDDYDRLLADLFAFLGEQNEIRRRVRAGDDLKDVLTRPLDLENIDQRIQSLTEERRAVESELERAEASERELVELERRKAKLESELEELQSRYESLADEDDSGVREELSDLQAEHDRVTDLVDRLERSIDRAQERLKEAHDEYESLEAGDVTAVEEELAAVREEYEQTRRDRELLQSVYSANSQLIEEGRVGILADVDHSLIEDTHECWVCGNETSTGQVEERLDAIGEKVLELREEASSYEEEIEELEATREERRRATRRKEDLEDEISDLEATISEREESYASAKGRLEIIEDRLSDLQDEAQESDDERSELKSEIKYTERELEDLDEEIEETARVADRRSMLEEEREDIVEEIESLRTRKRELKDRIRTEFDAAIGEIIQRFETSFESARLTSTFDLVIARDGREVSIDALSEGEVELLGLVAAVAGYEAYDVAERVPIILLDQLGALADDNLRALARYLEDRAEYLVLTAYPENSLFGDHRIDPGEWEVVSSARTTAA